MRLFISCFLLTSLLVYSQGVVAQSSNQSNSVEEKKRVALVIGNDNYTSWPKLTTSLNDAQDMTIALIKLGFSVILVQDADLNLMNEAIEEFVNQLDKDTEALFYFSGHGGQNIHSQSLLFSIDVPATATEEEVEQSAIKLNSLLSKMKDKESPTNIIILDACRSSSTGTQRVSMETGFGSGDNLDDPNTKQQRSDGFLIAYSTSPGRSSVGGNVQTNRRNSLYTHFLLKNFSYPGPSYVVFEKTRQDIVDDLKENLPATAEREYQVPWENNSLRQTVYLVPRKLYVHGGFQ